MRRRRARSGAFEPSLVPLADLLSNTVGVMVFIFIFTVLTAGGVSVAKRLPIEHSSKLKVMPFVCRGDRVLPLDSGGMIDRFLNPLGKPSFFTADEWLDKYKKQKVEDEFFVATGEGDLERTELGFESRINFNLSVAFEPRAGKGDTAKTVVRPDSAFRAALLRHKPDEQFCFFIVYPDALDVFKAAREVALAAGYSTGWDPQGANNPVRFSLTGSGRVPVPQ